MISEDVRERSENHECEFCGRSMIGRFGGTPYYECQSCANDFRRLAEAGKIEDGDGNTLEFTFCD